MDIVLPPRDSKPHSDAENGTDNSAYHIDADETVPSEHFSTVREDHADETASNEHIAPTQTNPADVTSVELTTAEPGATPSDEGPVPQSQLVCIMNDGLSPDTSSTVDDGHDVGQGTGDSNTSSADDYILGPKSAVETRFDAVPSKKTDFNLNRSGIFLPGRTIDPFVTTDGEDAPCSDSESTHSDPFLDFYQKVDLSQNVSEDHNYDTNQSGLEESKNAPRPMTILLPTEIAFLGRNNESDSSIQQITVNSMMMSSIVGRERGCDDDDDDDDDDGGGGGGGGTSSPSTSGASIEAYVAGVAFDETPDVICTTQL